MRLEGQVALITGGSRGLGRAIAGALGEEGATVACMARPGAELDVAVATLNEGGIRAIAAPADVTREREVSRAVDRVVEGCGRLDIVVLNAGTWKGGEIAETSEEQWDLLLDLNLKGAFLTLKHSIPPLVENRRGTVVGISSLGGLVGQPGSAAYAASKWGLRGLLESAALELKPHGIRVSVVHPHNINSAERQIPPDSVERQQNLEPVEIAGVVTHICTAPDHVTIGNVTVWPQAAGIVPKFS